MIAQRQSITGFDNEILDNSLAPKEYPKDNVARLQTVKQFWGELTDMIAELRKIGEIFGDKYFIADLKSFK